MFETLGKRKEDPMISVCAEVLERAISEHMSSGGLVTYDLGGQASTTDVGESIATRCAEILLEMGS